ncbi:hypothetical protein C8J56DRAFT_401060 [Mycena floridula]|nr:hypothetical protein C8J56DRAFT_401060 [Mycena floridula]
MALCQGTRVTQSLTAVELKWNPRLLLHCSAPASQSPLTAYDGKVGAILDNGRYFITSPTLENLLDPQLTGVSVQLRLDLHWGPDDPTLHPRVYVPVNCHYMIIRLRPDNPASPMSIFWWQPQLIHLIPDVNDTLCGLGKLSRAQLDRFTPFLGPILKEADEFCLTNTKASPYIGHFAVAIRTAYSRLKSLSSPFNQMLATVIEMQRAYLELRAVLDYMQHFKPILDSGILPSAPFPHKIMGAFISDIRLGERLFMAGIPFWLIRPVELLFQARIESIASIQPIAQTIEIRPARRSRVIFQGRADAPEKFAALQRHAFSFIAYRNPFAQACALTRAVASSQGSTQLPPPNVSVVRSKQSKISSPAPPYFHNRQRAPTNRNKFEEPTSRFTPPTSSVWSDALRDVDQSLHNPTNARFGYLYPDPGMFLGTETGHKMFTMVESWLRYRAAFMLRASRGAEPIATKQWRTLLNLNNIRAAPGTPNGQLHELAVSMLNTVLDDLEFNLGSSNGRLEWSGSEIVDSSNLSTKIVQEVLWELAELNFCFELSSLDLAQTTVDRIADIVLCFPTGHLSLLVADISAAKQGLAAESIREQAPFIRALCCLMSAWKGGEHLKGNHDISKTSDNELVIIEKAATAFYTQSFYDIFARACVIPRRLP